MTIVDAGSCKEMEIEVVIPVEDMADLGRASSSRRSGPAALASTPRHASIWPSI